MLALAQMPGLLVFLCRPVSFRTHECHPVVSKL